MQSKGSESEETHTHKKRRNKVLTERRYTRNKPVVVVFLESSVDLWAKSKILMLHFHVITLNNIKLNLN